jgi:hypothetical protein
MSRKSLVATLVTVGSTLAALPASAQLSTGERSRNDSTLEVVSGSKIYKHAISTLNRTETDTLIGTDWNTQYNVVSFDDQNLNVRQDKLFTF